MLSVSDTLSNSPEQIDAAVGALGRSQQRRMVFEAVYFGKKPIKSVAEIAVSTGLSEKVVLTAGKYLADHHIFVPTTKNGRVAYQKIGFFHKNKEKILSLANDKKKREKFATKRRPAMINTVNIVKVAKRELKSRRKLTVLYMLANPDPDPDPKYYIRPEAEARKVQEAVRASKFRDNVDIQIRVAANLQTILDGLNDHAPQVVHFSGHSSNDALAMDSGEVSGPVTQEVSYKLLSDALLATDTKPSIVVLNSCFSASAKNEILKSVDALVGMSKSVSDIAAAAFAPQFYAALSSGQSLASAFKQGVVAVSAASITEGSTPQLFVRKGIDPSKLSLT